MGQGEERRERLCSGASFASARAWDGADEGLQPSGEKTTITFVSVGGRTSAVVDAVQKLPEGMAAELEEKKKARANKRGKGKRKVDEEEEDEVKEEEEEKVVSRSPRSSRSRLIPCSRRIRRTSSGARPWRKLLPPRPHSSSRNPSSRRRNQRSRNRKRLLRSASRRARLAKRCRHSTEETKLSFTLCTA